MTTGTALFCSGLVAEGLAVFHFLRAKFPVPEPILEAYQTGVPAASALTLVDADPAQIRSEMLRTLDRRFAWAFLAAGLLLQMLYFPFGNSERPLAWVYVIMLLGAVYGVGAAVRFLIGVRFVELVKKALDERYRTRWKNLARKSVPGTLGMEVVEQQLHILLAGYISDEELSYILDSYRFKLEEDRKEIESLGH